MTVRHMDFNSDMHTVLIGIVENSANEYLDDQKDDYLITLDKLSQSIYECIA